MNTFAEQASNDPYLLEKFIQKLRVRFSYTRDSNDKVVTTVKSVHGFSHKTGADVKLVRRGNAEHDYGSSDVIKFHCDKYPPDITVTNYFKKGKLDLSFHGDCTLTHLEEYGIDLAHPREKAVNFGWIPAELGIVMPGQAFRGKLSDNQTSAMITIAARPPAENARRIVGAGTAVIGTRNDNVILVSALEILCANVVVC